MEEMTKKVQQYKVDFVNKLKEDLEGVNDVLFADYRGLNVEQITDLRNQLREKDAKFSVVKNNLAKIALKDLKKTEDDFDSYFKGPTAIAMVKSDVGPVAKVLVEFAKNAPLEIKGGIVGGKVFTEDQMDALSKLPGKEQLIAMLMSTMNAPLTNLMHAMNGVSQKLVRTLQAVADKKGNE